MSRRTYPHVKSVRDSSGNTFVRTRRVVGGGVVRERWAATVVVAGPLTLTVESDRMVLMVIEAEERCGSPEPVSWSEQHTIIPVKFMSARLMPAQLGNALVVDVTMPAVKSVAPEDPE